MNWVNCYNRVPGQVDLSHNYSFCSSEACTNNITNPRHFSEKNVGDLMQQSGMENPDNM